MSPIREALSKLVSTHLITFEEHKGYTVTKMKGERMRDDILTFSQIEKLCLEHSLVHGKDDWEGEILSSLHQLKKVETLKEVDFDTWAPLSANFHNTLV